MFGLRTVRAVFRRRETAVEITLFPMIHVGEARFYAEVYDDALRHDVVLYEGVGPKTGIHLAKVYEWMKPERLGLVVQPKLPESASARLVRADFGTKEMIQEWRKVPFLVRLLFQIAAPIYGIVLSFSATREGLAEKRTMDDKMSGDEILDMLPATESLRECIVHARDRRLVEHLRSELEESDGTAKRIAIVYGAGHMRAVIRELTSLGYHCSESKWVTIFKT
jgi:hypothetical protein